MDGFNLYVYVRNDPLNLVDPFGLLSEAERARRAREIGNAKLQFGAATLATTIALPEGALMTLAFGFMTSVAAAGEYYYSRVVDKTMLDLVTDVVTSPLPPLPGAVVDTVLDTVGGEILEELEE